MLAIQAAAASTSSKKQPHLVGSGNTSSNKSHCNTMINNNISGIIQPTLGSQQISSKDKNSSINSSLNSLNTLSQFGNLGLNPQQSVQAAMNALAASNSAKVKDYMSTGILRYVYIIGLNTGLNFSFILVHWANTSSGGEPK